MVFMSSTTFSFLNLFCQQQTTQEAHYYHSSSVVYMIWISWCLPTGSRRNSWRVKIYQWVQITVAVLTIIKTGGLHSGFSLLWLLYLSRLVSTSYLLYRQYWFQTVDKFISFTSSVWCHLFSLLFFGCRHDYKKKPQRFF